MAICRCAGAWALIGRKGKSVRKGISEKIRRSLMRLFYESKSPQANVVARSLLTVLSGFSFSAGCPRFDFLQGSWISLPPRTSAFSAPLRYLCLFFFHFSSFTLFVLLKTQN